MRAGTTIVMCRLKDLHQRTQQSAHTAHSPDVHMRQCKLKDLPSTQTLQVTVSWRALETCGGTGRSLCARSLRELRLLTPRGVLGG